MFLVVSNSVGNVSSNHVITWKQQHPITSFFDAHSAKVLFENKSSSPVILFWITHPWVRNPKENDSYSENNNMWEIYFFQLRLLHISTRADSDPLNFLEKEAICFLNRFIYWKLLLTGIRSSEQIEFLDALRFIYYLIQKGRLQGSLSCFEWSISIKNLGS